MMFTRITVQPSERGDIPTVRELHVTVASVLNDLARGLTREAIIRAHPGLEAEDIREVLEYAAALAERPPGGADEAARVERVKFGRTGADLAAGFGEPGEFAEWERKDA